MKLSTYFIIFSIAVSAVFCVDNHKNACNIVRKTQRVPQADLIIFSYNRPLQLYALLESVRAYITGLSSCHVLYRVGSDAYQHGYNQVIKEFPKVNFIRQGSNPRADFKPLLLQTLESLGDYVMFAVDDIIVTGHVNMTECIDVMEETGAYGFYLRMGLNLGNGATRPLPPYSFVRSNMLIWNIKDGSFDWGYPYTVDMTIYRKKDIAAVLTNIPYNSPNTLEGFWAASYVRDRDNLKGACFTHTKMVNFPLNLVNEDWKNPTMNAFSAEELLRLFNKGLKMDIQAVFEMNNTDAHMNYIPPFIKRVTA